MIKYAILIDVESPRIEVNELKELYGLADSAGYLVYDEITQQSKLLYWARESC